MCLSASQHNILLPLVHNPKYDAGHLRHCSMALFALTSTYELQLNGNAVFKFLTSTAAKLPRLGTPHVVVAVLVPKVHATD